MFITKLEKNKSSISATPGLKVQNLFELQSKNIKNENLNFNKWHISKRKTFLGLNNFMFWSKRQNSSCSIKRKHKNKNNSINKNKNTIDKSIKQRNKEIHANLKCQKKFIFQQYKKTLPDAIPQKDIISIINIKIGRKRRNNKSLTLGN